MSATAKQLQANRANALKSTGPKTSQGKQVSRLNAISHGVLSTPLLLEGEDPEEFQGILEGLVASLQPVGLLELTLVEKIAVVLWKQRRLIRAEAARIELNRLPRRIAYSVAVELNLDTSIFQESDLQPPNSEQVAWCRQVLAEYEALPTLNQPPSANQAPLIEEQLRQDADSESESVEAYLRQVGGLRAYLIELASYCRDSLKKAERFPLIDKTAEQVKVKTLLNANDQDTLSRYFTTLDNQPYKALKAFRETQAWRLKSLESEIVETSTDQPDTVAEVV